MSKERDEAEKKYKDASGNKELFEQNNNGFEPIPPFWQDCLMLLIIIILFICLFGGLALFLKTVFPQ